MGVYNKLDFFLKVDWKMEDDYNVRNSINIEKWNRIAPEIIAMSIKIWGLFSFGTLYYLVCSVEIWQFSSHSNFT